MAGDGRGFGKGELFDLVSEVGELRLTAMTRIDWGAERSRVDALLFAIADGAGVAEAADRIGVSVQQATAWLRKSGERELITRHRDSD